MKNIIISILLIIALFCFWTATAIREYKLNQKDEQIKILEQQVIEQTAEKEVYMKMLENEQQ